MAWACWGLCSVSEQGPPCRGLLTPQCSQPGSALLGYSVNPAPSVSCTRGRAACVPGSGLSDPRLRASCLEPTVVPVLQAGPEVVLGAPAAVGSAGGCLDWAGARAGRGTRVLRPRPPSPRAPAACDSRSLPAGCRASRSLLPPVRFGEPRADQAHGKRVSRRRGVGGPAGPLPECVRAHGSLVPWGPPSRLPPAAGTKPEPPAQREVLPHQSAADPRGLAAPRQAAADELD